MQRAQGLRSEQRHPHACVGKMSYQTPTLGVVGRHPTSVGEICGLPMRPTVGRRHPHTRGGNQIVKRVIRDCVGDIPTPVGEISGIQTVEYDKTETSPHLWGKYLAEIHGTTVSLRKSAKFVCKSNSLRAEVSQNEIIIMPAPYARSGPIPFCSALRNAAASVI